MVVADVKREDPLKRWISTSDFFGLRSGFSRRTRQCRRTAGARYDLCELARRDTARARHGMCELALICHYLTPIQHVCGTVSLQLGGVKLNTVPPCERHCSLLTLSPAWTNQVKGKAVTLLIDTEYFTFGLGSCLRWGKLSFPSL
jgi:hypothetical protein